MVLLSIHGKSIQNHVYWRYSWRRFCFSSFIKKANVVEGKQGRLKVKDADGLHEVVTLGDLVDRGPEHLQLFDLVRELREKLRLTLLVGNHDLVLLSSLLHEDAGFAYSWLRHGGHAFLAEVAQKYGL